MLVTLGRSALSSSLSARFMGVDLQLEASSETAGMNIIQWQQSSSEETVCLCGGCTHASPAFPHRPGCRQTSPERSGSRLLLSPFVGRALLGRAASDTAG